jgi:hypothetical protein
LLNSAEYLHYITFSVSWQCNFASSAPRFRQESGGGTVPTTAFLAGHAERSGMINLGSRPAAPLL